MSAYSLITPCAQCPFRTDIKPFITAERAESILTADGEFHCHKTIEVGDNIDDDKNWAEVTDDKNAQVCAGFLICLEHEGRPNQMMRIAERIGMYDASKLRMDAPVYRSIDDAVSAHRKGQRKRRAAKAVNCKSHRHAHRLVRVTS